MSSLTSPAQHQQVANGDRNIIYTNVTPSDVAEVYTYVIIGVHTNGAAGDITIEQIDGSLFTFRAVPPGATFECSARKVMATGTTATAIFGGVN